MLHQLPQTTWNPTFGANSRLRFQDLKLLNSLHHKPLKYFIDTFMQSHQTTKQRVAILIFLVFIFRVARAQRLNYELDQCSMNNYSIVKLPCWRVCTNTDSQHLNGGPCVFRCRLLFISAWTLNPGDDPGKSPLKKGFGSVDTSNAESLPATNKLIFLALR